MAFSLGHTSGPQAVRFILFFLFGNVQHVIASSDNVSSFFLLTSIVYFPTTWSSRYEPLLMTEKNSKAGFTLYLERYG